MSLPQLGDIALDEKEEYIPSHIFDAVDFERSITGRGTLIMVYNPSAPTPSYWEHTSTAEDATGRVPAGYEVKVIDGWVKMTK